MAWEDVMSISVDGFVVCGSSSFVDRLTMFWIDFGWIRKEFVWDDSVGYNGDD